MGANTCDGDVYIHNLATFIKSHERQLANALVAYKKSAPKTNTNGKPNSMPRQQQQSAKPVRLSLSLHHLYFLLGKFQELGISVGPMNIRLDNIDTEGSDNYVSFLSEFQRNKAIQSDAQSIHSMSSVKSVMSSVSALWTTLSSSGQKGDNIINDLKYLYSAFTKLPCLRLATDPNAKLIEGHEEYPFDTSTPIKIFKNLSVLEISDMDPKEIYGWHILSENIRFLVVKRTNVTDPYDILVTLVHDDINKRGSMYSEDSERSPSSTSSLAIPMPKRGSFSSPSVHNGATFSNSYGSSHHHYLSGSLPETTSPPSSYYASRLPTDDKYALIPRRQYQYQHKSRYTPKDTLPTIDQIPISSIPHELSKIHWRLLKHLSLTENKITRINEEAFTNLENLSSLDLSYNNLTEIPHAALAKLHNLKSLNLSYNKLMNTKTFPKTLTKLAILNLRGNQLTNLDTLENATSLEKIDLRQNKLSKVAEMKPLFLMNNNVVKLNILYLVGNPLASNRGYRIELFNLFNGVDYSNDLRIDGSRPGIFESRLLLDAKSAQLKLNKFLDPSIISKMAESVSTMNINKVITTTTTGDNSMSSDMLNNRMSSQSRVSVSSKEKHEDARDSIDSRASQRSKPPPLNLDSHKTQVVTPQAQILTPNKNLLNSSDHMLPPQKPFSQKTSSVQSSATGNLWEQISSAVPVSEASKTTTLATPVSANYTFEKPQPDQASQLPSPVASSQPSRAVSIDENVYPSGVLLTRQVNASNSSLVTSSSRKPSQEANPISKISLAAPAVPVITQATTMTTVSSDPPTPHSQRRSADHEYFAGAVALQSPIKAHTFRHPDARIEPNPDSASAIDLSIMNMIRETKDEASQPEPDSKDDLSQGHKISVS
ncbi:hypothetical protein KL905_004674 [Ogataea polymorpha]|nr:hypothetical protein KL908_000630 [Ogataea polymorpha]KAG7903916.1 hypothetical protein KL935_000055 [Ogataea polymorpha]KAG7908580.1 hypothetical protein KL907_002070 [Ogataea polymorpha]KAG7916271.1 hypothetical protein KL905_004674 [Ogataea polymorpha]KAG7920810.1 hypothetical protein KL927_000054 [Ogataea polymorpha]